MRLLLMKWYNASQGLLKKDIILLDTSVCPTKPNISRKRRHSGDKVVFLLIYTLQNRSIYLVDLCVKAS